ncbi:Rhomboid protease GluP [Gemmata obscuriglobus]|uniref:Peptidase S54 rhomboid domain-containing protein n=2 Tax=Gemmata obscuriglobus TaxID=114 RepID=A0A2Z3HBC4_9BACT|nr:hypothetical protein C1280_17050 [Gemmata obscuriglobus]QEG28527.1 Rhomboid protease GluP [Gemmata obscuriglobus]VTS06600.1 rhomboid family protein : Peptidase S54, rhomboid domain protein OS=Granulicella mallensis (strain ATCC BAA-1857 / DSM 23137 / MP5ACTX8) GN=AciX8_4761 PE=4 SV=1: Rhomboid [Gemmata obscuriglobus UQM 2246]
MAQSCPHCAAPLPDTWDAFCGSCRNPLPETEAAQPTGAADVVTEPGATQPAEPHTDDPTARFWQTLTEITPRPTVTRVLVAINLVIFGLMGASGLSLNQPSPAELLKWGADFGPNTLNGEWWRALTCMFVHIGILHILMNMWVLSATGPLVERMLGNAGFLVAYLVSGLGGSLASLWLNPGVVSAGASGAVFGIYGALLGLLQRQRTSIPPAALTGLKNSGLGFLAYNVFFGLTQPNIDLAAHAGGFVTGFLCGLVLSRPFTPAGVAARPTRNFVTGFGGFVVITVGLTLLSVAPPKIVLIDRELERCEELDKRARQFIRTGHERLSRGDLDDKAFAETIERSLLPEWREARTRLAALRGTSSHDDAHLTLVLDYMQLCEEGWTLYAEAVRTGDDGKAQEAANKHKLADALVDKIRTH